MQPAPESHRRNQRRERNQLLPLPPPKTSRVGDHLQKEDKSGSGPSNSQTSGDGAESILSRALTHSHHCHRCKIGPCHTSKWDPATSCAIRPVSVIDDHKEIGEKTETILKSTLYKIRILLATTFLELWKEYAAIKEINSRVSACVVCLTFRSDITSYIFDNLVYNGFTFRMTICHSQSLFICLTARK